MHKFQLFILLFFITQCLNTVTAQVLPRHDPTITPDSVRIEFDKQPSFSLYKDNYFIFGPPIGIKPTNRNTNIKFQVSVGLKVTKTTLPLGTYLYFFYNQKVFWNVLEKSLPMHDINFNPGIGLAKPLFRHGRYMGKVMLQVEHESNGRDSISSRSWNHIVLGGDVMLTNNILLHAKFWIPIIDGENNRDILRYCGVGQAGIEIKSHNNRWRGSLVVVKRKGWRMNFNTIVEGSWQFSDKSDWSLFAQYYNGYGESLLDYKTYVTQLRIGVVIRPRYLSYY